MITGGCLCGTVRFTITGEPLLTRVCWCRLCQRIGAGSGTVNVGFKAADVMVEGATTDYVSTADSGATLHRRFCPVCGTPLFSQAQERMHLIFIRVGALDDPEIARPEVTIWTSAAPSWASIADGLPRVERQPPPAA